MQQTVMGSLAVSAPVGIDGTTSHGLGVSTIAALAEPALVAAMGVQVVPGVAVRFEHVVDVNTLIVALHEASVGGMQPHAAQPRPSTTGPR